MVTEKKEQAKRKKGYRYQSLLELGMVLIVLFLLNLVLSGVFFRLDLTREKRFSLSKSSKELASKVDAQMYVKVYLEGEFPAGFKHLSRSIKEILDEFRVYSSNNIQYEFIDPFKDAAGKQENDIITELNAKGLRATNVQIKKEDEFAQKIIVPGALVFYKGQEYPVNFLREQFGEAPEEVINSSIELLEYEMANALRRATQTHTRKIAFIQDHGELSNWDIAEAKSTLAEFYKVEN